MTTYNDISIYMPQERRQPLHAAAMRAMINLIDDNVTIEKGVPLASLRVWLPYYDIVYGEPEGALDFDDAWGDWYNGAGALLAPALFTNIIESKTDPTTLERFRAAAEEWQAAMSAYMASDSTGQPDYDSIEQPVHVNAWR